MGDAWKELSAEAGERLAALERWLGGARSQGARSALFRGPPGAGRRAAALLGRLAGRDLHEVGLSKIVSKYIGETEKNLDTVFDGAERAGAVLLFDEADALFGRRSEVKDAHDRFANIEADFLLRRLASHRGLVILVADDCQDIDEAFLCRLDVVIDFPPPG